MKLDINVAHIYKVNSFYVLQANVYIWNNSSKFIDLNS